MKLLQNRERICFSDPDLRSDRFQKTRKIGLMIGYKSANNVVVSQMLETPSNPGGFLLSFFSRWFNLLDESISATWITEFAIQISMQPYYLFSQLLIWKEGC
jgi:hypothetical protein